MMHHSQLPEPPGDVIEQNRVQFNFPDAETSRLALKAWHAQCIVNNWTPSLDPAYVVPLSMFMVGFVAGYNCHIAKARQIARTN